MLMHLQLECVWEQDWVGAGSPVCTLREIDFDYPRCGSTAAFLVETLLGHGTNDVSSG